MIMNSSHITPKRRHSSLFERMQNQIKKISKKLSAAKQSVRQPHKNVTATFFHQNNRSNPQTEVRKKDEDFMQSMNSIDEQTVVPTVRNHNNHTRNINKNRQNKNYRAVSAVTNVNYEEKVNHSTAPLKDIWNNQQQTNTQHHRGKLIKGLSTAPLKKPILDNTFSNLKAQSFQYPSSTQSDSFKLILKLQSQNNDLSFKLGRMSSICENQSLNVGKLRAQLRETSRQLRQTKQRQEKQNCYLVTLLQHYKGCANKYKKLLKKKSDVSIDLESQSYQ